LISHVINKISLVYLDYLTIVGYFLSCLVVGFETFFWGLHLLLNIFFGLFFNLFTVSFSVFLYEFETMIDLLKKIISNKTLNNHKITVLKMLTAKSYLISMNPNISRLCCIDFNLFLNSFGVSPKLNLYLLINLFLW